PLRVTVTSVTVPGIDTLISLGLPISGPDVCPPAFIPPPLNVVGPAAWVTCGTIAFNTSSSASITTGTNRLPESRFGTKVDLIVAVPLTSLAVDTRYDFAAFHT